MAGAVLGLAVPGVVIEDVQTVAKTLPDFTRLWTEMLAARDAEVTPAAPRLTPDPVTGR